MLSGVVGLLSAVVDLLYTWRPRPALTWIHPLVGLVVLAYVRESTHRRAPLEPWPAQILALPAWLAFFAWRSLFIR